MLQASKPQQKGAHDGDDSGMSKSVLRLVLEAPGWAGRLCAPREMVVERMLKTEVGGVVCRQGGGRADPAGSARRARWWSSACSRPR